jgi:hypothetical protein
LATASASPGRRSAPGRGIAARRAGALAERHAYLTALLLALLLAAVSLALPFSPSYDPWAWLIWGREIAHGWLSTVGGPTWKPLPVLFTTPFSLAGAAAPALWLGVARAGGIFALLAAGMLARRLGGSRAAAGLALAGVLVLGGFADSVAAGESEGLLCALILLATLRHLDGARRQSLALVFLAGLLRPEVWPLLVLYGAWVSRRERGVRLSLLALLALTLALWFLPELWGSGSLLRGARWAQFPRAGSAARAACPFCAELAQHAWPLVLSPFKVGLLALAAAPLLRGRRDGGVRTAGALAVLALAWIVEEAVLTQLGFSGSDRYLLAPCTLLIVAGSAGWRVLAGWLLALRRAAGKVPSVAAAAGLGGLLVALSLVGAQRLVHPGAVVGEQRRGAALRGEVSEVIASGRPLTACGAIATNPSDVPLLAWQLDARLREVESGPGAAVVVQAPSPSSRQRLPGVGAGYRLRSRSGAVSVYSRCG